MMMHITERKDGRFMGRFVIGQKKGGKKIYQYVYGKTYEEALQKVQIGMEIESQYRHRKHITVLEVYQEWIVAVANRVKESSYANYRTKFEKHIIPEFGALPCSTITSAKVNTYIRKKLAEGLSANYVRDLFAVFKSMLLYGQEEYHFCLSLKNVVLPKPDKNKIKRMNIEEQKNLVKYLKGHLNPTTLGILLSLYMGLRIGELCGLTWADIDLNAKILSIRRTVQRVKSYNNGIQKTKIIVSTPKSDTSFREIPIPNFLVRYLQMFQKDNHCYFLSGKEKLIEPRTYQYRYKKILSQVGIKSHNYHQLRHTFATNCIQNGFDIKTLSVILGHKTVNMTLNRYIHPDYVHEQKLMNQLSLLF